MSKSKIISEEIINNVKHAINDKKSNFHHLHEPLIEKRDLNPIKHAINSGFVS